MFSRPHIFAVLPLSFISSTCFVHKFSKTAAFSIEPLANVVVSIGVDEPSVPVINVIDKLPFVDDVVYLFSDSCDLSVSTKLAYNIFIIR